MPESVKEWIAIIIYLVIYVPLAFVGLIPKESAMKNTEKDAENGDLKPVLKAMILIALRMLIVRIERRK